ncbi:MAG: serine/threonine protein kinase, partial [Myxococcota bacterium]|nr:serine/threonine protein kinase [Myxococcota bacterium]
MPVEIGQLIEGKYRIVRLVGEGGMGSVYEGQAVRINRRVAIKVLHAAFSGNQEVMQRFEREAQAAGRIGNDHILEVLDLGSLPDGDHYIVMEFLDGESLSARIRARGRMSPQELTPLIRQVLVGLGAAHTAGIVHRDLKPDNIFILKEKLGRPDFVKIIDFGISKFQPLSGDGMKMTRTGAVMGTPYYMSPEQASGSHEADQRSDLYSVGVMMFEAVTGRVPFDAGTFNQLMFKIVLAEVPTVESIVPDIDPAYSSVIAKAMARDVSFRFQDSTEFVEALDNWAARGASVSVPPTLGATPQNWLTEGANTANVPGFARTPGPALKTGGTWETSQPELPAATTVNKQRGGAGAVIGVVLGLGVLGGVAFGAYSLLGDRDGSVATAAQPASSPPPAEPAPPPPSPPEKPPEVTPEVTPEPVAPA